MTNECRYFFPGPAWVRPEILGQMARPLISHRSAEFRAIFRDVTDNLARLFVTSQHAFVATSSGTGLMEGALLNTVKRRVLVTTCGAFSERWQKIAEQTGIEVDTLAHGWGTRVDPTRLADHLRSRRGHYDAITITHNETSTGVLNDLKTLASVIRQHSEDTLILVDAVSSFAGAELRFDEWGLDVALASVQKGLALPPGLTVFAVSERAMKTAEKKNYRGTYFDFLDYRRNAETDGTPTTPAVSIFFALQQQLRDILDGEGIEGRWARHRALRDRTIERTNGIAELLPDREAASPTVSTLRPTHTGAVELVQAMKSRGFTLGSGYGELKPTTFRIGHMGDVTVAHLDAMLDVLIELAS